MGTPGYELLVLLDLISFVFHILHEENIKLKILTQKNKCKQ